jgi:hypothetical protein
LSYTPTEWQDRIVEKPRTYHVQNNPDGTITLIPAPGTVIQEGTPVNAANLQPIEDYLGQILTPETAALYGLDTDAVPDEVLEKLSGVLPWRLLQTYTTAGAFIWTAPDIHSGQPYEIGVYEIGGGGSGGAAANADGYPRSASGGASGYAKAFTMTVTPGQSYNIVVGAGGTSVSASGYSAKNGNAGGSTSFNGESVNGGSGGLAAQGQGANVGGADGGQGSDQADIPGVSPCGGSSTKGNYDGSTYKSGGRTTPIMSLNPFDQKRYLAAGGSPYQTGGTLEDGTKGGDGATAVSAAAVATAATGNGNGGGAASASGSGCSATSGAGSAGAVFIYARGYEA